MPQKSLGRDVNEAIATSIKKVFLHLKHYAKGKKGT
jgi:hypothetical protein